MSGRWLLLACLLLPAAGQATVPQRVVSLNLCTDAMLFELARPGQIAAVTRLSRDPALSRFAREAARTPVIHGMAEEVLALAPDLVLAAPDSAAATLALLERLGLRIERFTAAGTLAEFRADFARLAALLGRAAYGRTLLDRFDHGLARLAEQPAIGAPALFYLAGGYTPGSDTLADELLALAGLDNAAPALDYAAGGFVPLEQLVAAPPALLLLGESPHSRPALADALLAHPAVAHGRRDGRLAPVRVPERDWACGGTHLPAAAGALRSRAQRALAAAP